ncbi:accessory factor associated with RNA polymerase II [Lambiella insularis]|nr:accessory factor associated with RNA polymerase II [Lambiella insularis]
MAPHEGSQSERAVASHDTDQSYFRQWKLRGTDRTISSEEISPTGHPTKNKTRRPARGSDRWSSDGLAASNQPVQSPLGRALPIRRSSSLEVQPEASRASRKLRKSSDTLFSRHSTPATSSSKRESDTSVGDKLLSSKNRSSQGTASQDQVANKSRPGLQFKRHISSHLIEVRISRKSPSESLQKVVEVQPTRQADLMQLDHARFTQEAGDNTVNRGLAVTEATGSPASLATETRTSIQRLSKLKVRETLYCRVKRRLRLKKGPVLSPESETVTQLEGSETKNMLNQASEMLRNLSDQKSLVSVISRNTSRLSIAGIHDHGDLFLRRSGLSASSSLRHLFLGRPPMPSPELSALYRGSDNEDYFRVEMSNTDAPNFLPSEARRVGTPPLPSTKSGHKTRPLRGFFFDYRPPGQQEPNSPSWEPSNDNLSNGSGGSGKRSGDSVHAAEREWFRVKVSRSETKESFELGVPEHLPNSPLCPSNPKNNSGGNGICPYHGRARKTSILGQVSVGQTKDK